jgi:polyhydroxybutyrate depolymerase
VIGSVVEGLMTSRLLALLVVFVSAASGCRCGGGQTAAPERAAPKSGCRDGTVERVGGLVRTVSVDGKEREYILDVPGGSASAPLPVVFMFHGIGGSPGPLREATGMGEEAHERGFIGIHPVGLSVWLKGRVGPGWQIQAEENRDVRLVEEIIDQVDSLYCVDRDRVFAAGFSNGAHLAHVLACGIPGRIAAIGAVGGGLREMKEGCGPSHAVPAVIVHGDADSIVGVEEGRQAHVFWVERNGCREEEAAGELCTLHTGCDSEKGVLFCELPSFGHAWPMLEMGDPVDATTLLLDFFLGSAEPPVPALEPDEQPQVEEAKEALEVHFKARVLAIKILGQAKGEVIPVHADPRWAMKVKILSVVEEGAPLSAGATKIFAIHSPTRLFAGDAQDAIGKTYEFVVNVKTLEDGWDFGVLRLEKYSD